MRPDQRHVVVCDDLEVVEYRSDEGVKCAFREACADGWTTSDRYTAHGRVPPAPEAVMGHAQIARCTAQEY
jgi:hypothetical protein